MVLSEKVMQRYREFYCCNPRQITLGHHSEHRPLGFSMYFLPYFPSPQSLLVSKETIHQAQIFRHTQHGGRGVRRYRSGGGTGGALAPSLFWLIK